MFVLFWVLCLSVIIGLCFVFWRFYTRNDYYWEKLGYKFVGPEITWSTGSFLRTQTPHWEFNEKIYQRAQKLKEPYVGFLELTKPGLMIVDMDIAKLIFIKEFDTFMDRRSLTFEDTDPMFHKMLFFMESEPWKQLRNKMTPTFTTGKIKRMYEIFNNSGSKLIKHLEKQRKAGGDVDFYDGFQKYSMDVIASAAFGLDAKLFEGETMFQKMGETLIVKITPKIMFTFMLLVLAPKVASALKLGLLDKKAEAYFKQILQDAIYERKKSGQVRDDFLQLMIEASNEKEDSDTHTALLSDEVIIAQSVLFILAGFDTTNSLLLFSVYELALNPEIQDKLYQELKELKEENNGQFSYEGVNNLEYMDKVVNETLRKYPPVPALERKTMRDFEIPGTKLVIPKDVLVRIPTFSIHHDPKHFPNPKKFDPERFSNETKALRHPMAFQPFGHGPRHCIAMRFALFNAKMSIANVVYHYLLEPTEKTTIPMEFGNESNLKPKNGMRLKLKSRDN